LVEHIIFILRTSAETCLFDIGRLVLVTLSTTLS